MMNIHKSKGLEFPICYFTGFPKTFNLSDLKNKFMFDNKYGIITPYYKDGIGEVFIKQLVKNEYYLNEVAEKIRLFYVALTRAKEKIIMVMPEVIDKTRHCEEVDFLEGLGFRSFYNFLESIYGNIAKYVTSINLNNIGLSKEYEFSKAISRNLESSKEEMIIYDDEVLFEEVEKRHASKTIRNFIKAKSALNKEYFN